VGCSTCKLKGACQLPGPLDLALDAFFEVLERYTLAQVMGTSDGSRLLAMLGTVSEALVSGRQTVPAGTPAGAATDEFRRDGWRTT
jgi:hypothetical protein